MKGINVFIFLMIIFTVCVSGGQIIEIDVPTEKVSPGDLVYVNVNIDNSEDFIRKDDYEINAFIIDENENIILEKSKVIALSKQVSTVISFDLPEDISGGNYKVLVIVDESESLAYFKVDSSNEEFNIFYLIEILIILNAAWIILYLYKKFKKKS